MNKPYSILMQKMKEGSAVKDLLDDFGMVCTDFPFGLPEETKDLPSRSWAEEDGEDTYIPDKIPLKAYDLDISLCYNGAKGTAVEKVDALLSYLTGEDGGGASLKIYNGKTGTGLQEVYLAKTEGFVLWQNGTDEILEFDMTLHVCDPRTRIVPKETEGVITGLSIKA